MNRAAQQLGRLGGKSTSEAKTTAARKNGAKGGRPKEESRRKLSTREARRIALIGWEKRRKKAKA